MRACATAAFRVAERAINGNQGQSRSIKVHQGPSRANVNQWQSVAIDETHLCARGGLTGGLEVGSGLVQLGDFGL
jgi:hypothetical protein